MKHLDNNEPYQLVIIAHNGKWHLEEYPGDPTTGDPRILRSFEQAEKEAVIHAFITRRLHIANTKIHLPTKVD